MIPYLLSSLALTRKNCTGLFFHSSRLIHFRERREKVVCCYYPPFCGMRLHGRVCVVKCTSSWSESQSFVFVLHLFCINSNSEVISLWAVVTSFRIVTTLSNFHKWTCLICLLTLLWTHMKVFVLANAVRGWFSWLEALWSSALLFISKVSWNCLV